MWPLRRGNLCLASRNCIPRGTNAPVLVARLTLSRNTHAVLTKRSGSCGMRCQACSKSFLCCAPVPGLMRALGFFPLGPDACANLAASGPGGKANHRYLKQLSHSPLGAAHPNAGDSMRVILLQQNCSEPVMAHGYRTL